MSEVTVVGSTSFVTVDTMDDVDFSAIAVRTHKADDPYIIEQAEDIIERGLLNLPSVVASSVEGKYTITDGAVRVSALKYLEKNGLLPEAHFPGGKITFQLKEVADNIELLCDQIAGNARIKKTGNREYINAIYLVASSGKHTIEELCKKIGMNETYLFKLFSTLKIPKSVYEVLKEKGVNVGNTITLAKLRGKIDEDEMLEEWVDKAANETGSKFAESVQAKLDDLKETSGGREPATFKLKPKLMTRAELQDMLVVCKANFEDKATEANEARFQLMKEIFQIDEVSEAEQRKEWEENEEQKKKNKEDRAESRKMKKLEDAKALVEGSGFEVVKPEDK